MFAFAISLNATMYYNQNTLTSIITKEPNVKTQRSYEIGSASCKIQLQNMGFWLKISIILMKLGVIATAKVITRLKRAGRPIITQHGNQE